MKIKMLRNSGGKVAGSVHDLSKWAATNFIRMHAARRVCEFCGEAPATLDAHICVKQMPAGINRMMQRGQTR